MPSRSDSAPRRPWWALLLASTCALAALLWMILALQTGRQCSWMAVVVALDAAVVLRLCARPRGSRRALTAALATGAAILFANWGIVALHLGAAFGLNPWSAASKLGLHHAHTLASLANGPADHAWLAVALVVAVAAGR